MILCFLKKPWPRALLSLRRKCWWVWAGPFLGRRDAGFVTEHLLDFCCHAHGEQLGWLRVHAVPEWGGSQPPRTVPPPRPQGLYGDVSCRCHVLTIPDSAGEAVGAAVAPDAGGSSGLPVPAFSGTHTGSFRPACGSQIPRVMGAAWASVCGRQRKERKRAMLGMCSPPSPAGPPGETPLCCGLQASNLSLGCNSLCQLSPALLLGSTM